MRIKIRNLFMIAMFVLLSSGCGTPAASTKGPDNMGSSAPALEGDGAQAFFQEQGLVNEYNRYRASEAQVALVTDVSTVMDNSFNQAAFEGIQTYADAACALYSCYSTYDDTPESYRQAVLTAIRNNAELVVCVGSHFEQAVGDLQNDYGNVSFLMLDGVPRDALGNEVAIAPNVHCITYREEEAGYLVGYMAVLEGYRKFGFIGGEQLPSVERYGYGYLRGIEDAASELEVVGDIEAAYWYAGTFSPDKQIEEVSEDWYQSGTEIIFACGGALYQSVLSSAEDCGGRLIGVDVDQSDISELFLTSAMKGIDASIIVALDEFFANGRKWPEKLAGHMVSYGAREKCVSLPVQGDAWRFETATTAEYLQLLARLRAGEIQILADADNPLQTAYTVIYYDQQEESDS